MANYADILRSSMTKRSLKTLVGAIVLTALITLISHFSPVDIRINLAVCPVIGLLFGPYGVIGVDLVSFVYNSINGVPMDICMIDLITTFIVSYIPYRLWYSTYMKGSCQRPTLDTVSNVVKFILVLVATAACDCILYNLVYGIMNNSGFVLGFDDLVRFLNVIAFSQVYGFASVFILRYLSKKLNTPRFNFPIYERPSKINPMVFNICFIIGLLLPIIILWADGDASLVVPVAVITHVFFILFMLKPMKIPERKKSKIIGGQDNTIIERIIGLILLASFFVVIIAIFAVFFDLLMPFAGYSGNIIYLFYISLALLLFLIPAVLFMAYLEKTVADPLTDMSEAAGNYISGDGLDKDSEKTREIYSRYTEVNTEIGSLALSLTKMTEDMEDYVENLKDLTSKQERLTAELSIAGSIQHTLIPTNFEVDDRVDLYGSMTPARFVGGDLYDFLMIDENRMMFMIGDVSGKGVPAALFMSTTKALVKSHAMNGMNPDELVSAVNDGLYNDMDMFVTSWMGIIDLSTGVVSFVNAGHNPPVLMKKNSSPELLKTKPGLVLGAMDGIVYKQYEVTLNPGDRLLLYTDGVTEANSNYNGFYGEDRLLDKFEEMRSKSMLECVESIKSDVLTFMGDSEQFDDITMLGIEYKS